MKNQILNKILSARLKYLLLFIIVLIIAWISGFYFGNIYSNEFKSDFNKNENIELPAVRNTPVVEAVKKVGPSVVGITSKIYGRDIFNRKFEINQSTGSGVIFDEKGYIVTNNHVVSGSDDVNVLLSNGKTINGKVIGKDAITDLAVIKIDTQDDLPTAVFGDSEQLQVGETAIAIGNPLGLEFKGTVTVGVISALNRTLDNMEHRFKLIQTDAAINPGNSGGALATADGKVIGINSSKIMKQGIEGIGFAIPINQVKDITSQLIKNGRVIRSFLGASLIDEDLANRYGYDWSRDAGGVLVLNVYRDGPIDVSGIEIGDYLMQINDKPVNKIIEIREILSKYSPGEKINVTYESDGVLKRTIVELGESPENLKW